MAGSLFLQGVDFAKKHNRRVCAKPRFFVDFVSFFMMLFVAKSPFVLICMWFLFENDQKTQFLMLILSENLSFWCAKMIENRIEIGCVI